MQIFVGIEIGDARRKRLTLNKNKSVGEDLLLDRFADLAEMSRRSRRFGISSPDRRDAEELLARKALSKAVKEASRRLAKLLVGGEMSQSLVPNATIATSGS